MRKVLGFADVMNQQKKQTVNLEEERSFPISELNGFALVQLLLLSPNTTLSQNVPALEW